jgi:CheY-like chemotaxis protein
MTASPDTDGPLFYASREGLRILFVDDDPILREFAVVNLASEHTIVETAQDGVAALEAVAANAPEVVLLDLEMPNLDGFEVLKRLRADPRHQALPVVVVTGREDIEAVERAFAAGATSFVVKPLNWRLLSHQLRYVRRTATAEQAAVTQRDAAHAQLHTLAAHATQFIADALAREPALRPTAVAFARAADAALQPSKSADAA